METSTFLAKVLGLYLIIVPLYVIIRHKDVSATLQAINKDRGTLLLVAIITLILGILLVVSHNVWSHDWRLIITIIAWLTFIGGIFRLFFQDAFIRANQWLAKNKHASFIILGIFLLLGLILTYIGFF